MVAILLLYLASQVVWKRCMEAFQITWTLTTTNFPPFANLSRASLALFLAMLLKIDQLLTGAPYTVKIIIGE